MRHLTLGYLTIGEATPLEIIDAAAAAGFELLGLRIVGRKKDDPFPSVVGDPGMLADVKRRLADSKLRLSNVTGNYLAADAKRADLQALVETGAALGSDYIAVTGHDPDEARLTTNLAVICEMASDLGLRVALEFVPYSSVINLMQAFRIATSTGFPNAGIRIDALHFARSGGVPADIGKVDPARLFYVQVCDGPRASPPTPEGRVAESRGGRFYPGEGELPLFEILDLLPAGLEIEIETPHPKYMHLSFRERATLANQSLRAFLAAYEKR